MPDRTGQQLGNYRLLKRGDEDDSSEFYLGVNIQTQKQAILKVAKSEKITPERFLAQARPLLQLTHPHIVPILEANQDGSTPFLVLNYTSFETLRQIYPRGRQLDLPPVIRFVKQIAEALQYAHERNILHGDIRPENLLPGPQQSILLNNFSIGDLNAHQRMMSSAIYYTAPELLQGQARPASDEYSLGIVAYEWLSGWPPFSGANYQEIADQQRSAIPQSLRSRVPSVPPDVERVIMRALEKDQRARFDTVLEFAIALEEATTSTFRSQAPFPLAHAPSQPTPMPGRSVSPTVAASLSQTPFTQAAPGNTTAPEKNIPAAFGQNTPQHFIAPTIAASVSQSNSGSVPGRLPTTSPDSLYAGHQISAPPPPAESLQGKKNPYGDLQAPSIQYPVYPSVPQPVMQPMYNYAPAMAVPVYVPPPRKPLRFPLTRGEPLYIQALIALLYSALVAISIAAIANTMIGYYRPGSNIYTNANGSFNGSELILTLVLILVIIPACSLFCGAFFGAWRGLGVSILSVGIGLFFTKFSVPPFWVQTDLPGYAFLAVLPLTALITGGIYTKRKYAAWWKSWFTLMLGVAIICAWTSITLAVADGISPSFNLATSMNITTGSTSTVASAIATSFSCLSLLVLLILSLTTAILEGIIHSIVASTKRKKAQATQAR